MATDTCLFNEPWIGRCPLPVVGTEICCSKHTVEKCHVCGSQSLTRCQASIGMMCGVPLCHDCGRGEMCLHHASEGPLMVIRALLGGGPVPSVFADAGIYEREQDRMDKVAARLRTFKFRRYEPAAT
jgi:hypothetical protein